MNENTGAEKRGLFRILYDWTMANASGRYA